MQGLRATLREVSEQRDRYRDRLARTNAELKSSSAHAQIMSATAVSAVGAGVAGPSAALPSPVPVARRGSLGVQQLVSGRKSPKTPRAIPARPGGASSSAGASAPEEAVSRGRERGDRSERRVSVLDLLSDAGAGGDETRGAGKAGGNPLGALLRGDSTLGMSDEGDEKDVGHDEGKDWMEGSSSPRGGAGGGADVAGDEAGYDSEEAPSMFF